MSPAPGRSRRSLLATMGLGLVGAVGAAGCGSSRRSTVVHITRRSPGAAADAHTLNRLLAVEYHAIAAYTAAAPLLPGSAARVARQFLGQEVLHADRLIALIERAGGHPVRQRSEYDLGHPRGAEALMRLLLEIEHMQLTAYLAAIPVVSPGSLKAAAASILADQAQHAALWRLQLGQRPAPTAFVTGHD